MKFCGFSDGCFHFDGQEEVFFLTKYPSYINDKLLRFSSSSRATHQTTSWQDTLFICAVQNNTPFLNRQLCGYGLARFRQNKELCWGSNKPVLTPRKSDVSLVFLCFWKCYSEWPADLSALRLFQCSIQMLLPPLLPRASDPFGWLLTENIRFNIHIHIFV